MALGDPQYVQSRILKILFWELCGSRRAKSGSSLRAKNGPNLGPKMAPVLVGPKWGPVLVPKIGPNSGPQNWSYFGQQGLSSGGDLTPHNAALDFKGGFLSEFRCGDVWQHSGTTKARCVFN